MDVGNRQQVKTLFAVLAGVIIAIASIVRFWLATHANWPPFSDSRDYHAMAKNIVAGLGCFQRYHGETAAHEGFTFFAYRMPGYPVFLAAIYSVFGFSTIWAYLAQALIESVGLILFWLFAKWLVPPSAATIALFFLSCNVYWTASLTTEVLFDTLIIFFFWWLMARKKFASLTEVLLMGVAGAATIFVRPVGLLLYPILLWRMPPKNIALFCLPLVMFMAAWGYRNYRILDMPVFLSTNFGWHNAPTFGVDREALFTSLRAEGKNEAEINQAITHAIVQRITEDPALGFQIFIERFLEMFRLKAPHEISQFIFKRTFSERVSAFLRVAWGQFTIIYVLGAGGVLASYRNKKLMQIFLAAIVTIALHGLMSDGTFRFFAPWYCLVCLFAGLGVHFICRWCVRCLHAIQKGHLVVE